MIKLQASISVKASEGATPTISGVAVPWNVEATVSDGSSVMFLEGSLPDDGPAPKLLESHDLRQVRGIVTGRESTPAGMLFEAQVARTAAGNDVIELMKMGAIDSVSVGVNPTKFTFKGTTMIIEAAEWVELSLVAVPAFSGARISEIAAETPDDPEEETPTDPEEDSTMDNTPEVVEAAAPATIPTAPLYAQARKEFKMPSAGEWITKVLAGGSEAEQFYANIRAAAPDVITTDTPGILPTPILGPVYNNYMPNWRPLVAAMGPRAMPGGGQVFRRPVVTTHTTIGASNGENVNLDQGTFVVTNNNITKQVFGGFVRLSEEAYDWTEPEVINLILDDMARIYADETDVFACAQFEAGVTQTATLTAATNPKNWAEFVYEAAETILRNSNGSLPNVLILDPLYYRNLGALVDKDDRPLFPNLNPSNAFGSLEPGSVTGSAFGLQLVVDRNLVKAGGNNVYVGQSSGFEVYEQQKGAVQVEAADGSLSRFIKFRGYFATFMVDATKFVVRG